MAINCSDQQYTSSSTWFDQAIFRLARSIRSQVSLVGRLQIQRSPSTPITVDRGHLTRRSTVTFRTRGSRCTLWRQILSHIRTTKTLDTSSQTCRKEVEANSARGTSTTTILQSQSAILELVVPDTKAAGLLSGPRDTMTHLGTCSSRLLRRKVQRLQGMRHNPLQEHLSAKWIRTRQISKRPA